MTIEEVTALVDQLNVLVSVGSIVDGDGDADNDNDGDVYRLQDIIIGAVQQLGKRANTLFVGVEVCTLELTQERDRLYLLQETLRVAGQLCDELISVVGLAQLQLRNRHAELTYHKQTLEEAK